jgi:hypothetical protein
MFAPLDAKQGLAATRKCVGEGPVKLGEIGIGGLSVLAAVRRDETNGIRGKPPAIDIEAGWHRSDQLILRGSGEQGGEHVAVGLPVEPPTPNSCMTEPAGEHTAGTAAHDQRFAAQARFRPPGRIDDECSSDPWSFLR